MGRPRAAADPFVAVADPTRRAILDLLWQAGGQAPFAHIAARFSMSAPAVSRHLRVLRDARLIRERRDNDDARQRIYRLEAAPLREVAEWAAVYQRYWTDNLARLKQHAERTHAARARATPTGRPSRRNDLPETER